MNARKIGIEDGTVYLQLKLLGTRSTMLAVILVVLGTLIRFFKPEMLDLKLWLIFWVVAGLGFILGLIEMRLRTVAVVSFYCAGCRRYVTSTEELPVQMSTKHEDNTFKSHLIRKHSKNHVIQVHGGKKKR